MTVPEKAVAWAVRTAQDDSHGYDQASRWGADYDCSSLVISAYKAAGLPLTSTYTGNMRSDFFANGFAVSQGVNLATGAGLRPGDVLLNETHHTALYIGDGKLVQASGNEMGGVLGGKTGDQTGREIAVYPYYNYPWDYVLRYVRKDAVKAQENVSGKPGKYTVQSGDTLWGVAARILGAGERYVQLMTANNLTDTMIFPGQVLTIPEDGVVYQTVKVTVRQSTLQRLGELAEADGLTIGQAIDKVVSA